MSRQPSIRRSLLVRCGAGVGLMLCLLSVSVYWLVSRSLFRELDSAINDAATLLAGQVELEHGSIEYEWQTGLAANRTLLEGALFQFWNEKDGSTARSPNLHEWDLPRFGGSSQVRVWRDVLLPGGHRGRAVGLRCYPFVLGEEIERMKASGQVIDPKTLPHELVVARDAEPIHHTLARLRWLLLAGTVVTLGIGFALVHRAVNVSLEPIDTLAGQVRGRTGRELDEALKMPGKLPVELTGLANDFDQLLGRMARTRSRERDFIRHAAHELRTPIAGLRATTDLALSQPREAREYAASLAECQRSAEELSELVKRLSALARIGTTAEPVAKIGIPPRGFLEECARRFHDQAAARGMKLEMRVPEDARSFRSDPALLRIILNNLLDNAVYYGARGSDIRLSFQAEQASAVIVVGNLAEELPADLERLFEPLFRAEFSRHDSGEHLGIGLTLSRDAAQALGGSLTARPGAEAGWIEFVLELPA